MNLGIDDRTALVTGASRGIGYACAEALAEAGCRVAVNARNGGPLEEAAADLEDAGAPEAVAVPGDLAEAGAIDDILAATRENLGDPDILVANAGGPPPGGIDDLDDGDWLEGVDLTLMSAVRLTRQALPAMRDEGWGRIAYVTSVSVLEPIPNLLLSNSLRMAVTGMMKTVSQEAADDGVTLNCVAPGYTATERLEELGRDLDDLADEIPRGRLAEPREVGDAVAWLCSERGDYITGQTLAVEGGRIKGTL
jgi:3-oxoacyl-[acyl-carrier protein] reductase